MNDLMTKSFVSYVDLKKEAMKDLEAGPDPNIQMTAAAIHMDKHLGSFLDQAEKVKEQMGSIRVILTRLQESNEESKTLHKPESVKALRHRINADVLAVLRAARGIGSELQEMDRANAVNRRVSGCKSGTPVDRTRTAVTNGLRRKLKELMVEFQGLRERMMDEYKETVGRRYFTVTGENPDEEVIEKIISSGNGVGGEDFLKRAIQVLIQLFEMSFYICLVNVPMVKRGLGATIELLHYDLEVIGSSCRNSLVHWVCPF